MIEFTEKIILETRNSTWITASLRGCGILARTMVGKHDEDHQETRRVAWAFAHQVIQTIGLASPHEQLPTPQVLINAADAAIEDTERTMIICTTWRYSLEGMEICSIGTNTVLLFDGANLQKLIAPHNGNEQLRSQGLPVDDRPSLGMATHALGSRKWHQACQMDDIRVARVPLSPMTTIAVIATWYLAEDILHQAISRDDLSSFIAQWKRGANPKTHVLISL